MKKIKSHLEEKNEYPSVSLLIGTYGRAISGGIATGVSLLIDNSMRTSVVITWLLVRALRFSLPSIKHGDIIIMCLSASQILSSWIRAPEDLAPSYLHFLYHQGGKSKKLLKIYLPGNPIQAIPCDYSHPGYSCWSHVPYYFLGGLRRALPVYIPVHLISLFLSRRKSLSIFFLNLIRSSMFLSGYCTLAWFSSCMYFRMYPGVTRKKLLVCTWFSGLSLLLEHPSRRPELAAYCLTHAIHSIWNFGKKKKYVSPNNFMASLLMMISIGILLHHWKNQPQFITKYLYGLNSKKETKNKPQKK